MIREHLDDECARRVETECPSGAFEAASKSLDMGKCVFCGECRFMSEGAIDFTNDHRMASNMREKLIITSGSPAFMPFDHDRVRKDIAKLYGRALRLRQVSAGGDNSCEMELNASMNVNFDFGRYGVEFTASPRHADGIVLTGPVTRNMSEALEICYEAIATPKLIIAVGSDAISGGLFAQSPALDRTFMETHTPDLYVPGNPAHPLTFIDGVRKLLGHKLKR